MIEPSAMRLSKRRPVVRLARTVVSATALLASLAPPSVRLVREQRRTTASSAPQEPTRLMDPVCRPTAAVSAKVRR